jgi:hypothetical protein
MVSGLFGIGLFGISNGARHSLKIMGQSSICFGLSWSLRGRPAGTFDGFPATAALLGLVLAATLVLSPAAVVAAARRDTAGQERKPRAVDRADVVVRGRRLVGDPAV